MRQNHEKNLYGTLILYVILFVTMFIGTVLSGCSPRVRPTVVAETRTSFDTDSLTHLIKAMMAERSAQREKETVYVFDKTTYTVNTNGDTVGKERDRVTDWNHDRESKEARYLHVIDSLRHARNRVDSVDVPVPYPVEVPVETEKPLSWWQTALMWAGGAGLLVACIRVGRLTGSLKK